MTGVDIFMFALLASWIAAREWLHRWQLKRKDRL
jgi:hypothetical protein